MIIPVRCFSCGKPIGHLWEDFVSKTNNRTQKVKETLDDLGVERYCCRAMFMGQVDLMDTVSAFKKF
ncbi:TPA: DNA-directed RNA polymerase subunit N [Candidatus Woesearchaeota archaeon]|nr:DNA-directed RNA polymerase, subunit N [archaeon GW2011_AR15]MBS3103723.1 DNA-directed RNA polymerase subunit N [Candidatus Woesearchaeota archaeon]HIH41014.1 DNA-directed RNA polymerase subunit N [Candidatus Woesearchaeota archaeon]